MSFRSKPPVRRLALCTRALLALALVPAGAGGIASAQQIIRTPDAIITVAKGGSVLLRNEAQIQRFSIGDPAVAEAVIITPTEVLLNAKAIGTTTLLTWDSGTHVRLYTVEVTPDAAGLERYLHVLMPNEPISVAASGNAVTLTGQVKDASAAARAVEIAKGSGATVIDNLTTNAPVQVLLQVRFAEMTRNALQQYSSVLTVKNPQQLSDGGSWSGSSDSFNGLLQVALFNNATTSFDALLHNLQTRGQFRSLAEPNLLTLPGKEAYFLAGGEFPFPVVQGGSSNSVSIVFKEFGIKLRFTPTITRNGTIRLKLAPEVSSLDFANALQISGFTIPSLLTRRAETEVEMSDGEHLAIAGLMDNSLLKSVSKIPILGDIPIIGQLFRSKDIRERRTELVVIVTPKLVHASDSIPSVTTGEPSTWNQDKTLRKPATADSSLAR